ncbi:MAG: preprotein translocase subunit SecE [Rhodobacteraceae bacterium]|nr:preprotein translocase subunit SecE [Paracoccaceae bacterium]
MAKFTPFQFMQQVRSEVSKVVWPTRRELLVTTAMVFAMAALASIFFFLIDQVIAFGLTSLLDLF